MSSRLRPSVFASGGPFHLAHHLTVHQGHGPAARAPWLCSLLGRTPSGLTLPHVTPQHRRRGISKATLGHPLPQPSRPFVTVATRTLRWSLAAINTERLTLTPCTWARYPPFSLPGSLAVFVKCAPVTAFRISESCDASRCLEKRVGFQSCCLKSLESTQPTLVGFNS